MTNMDRQMGIDLKIRGLTTPGYNGDLIIG
jgi:hypothetical protein